jgi:sulfite exporter TauE/SafE
MWQNARPENRPFRTVNSLPDNEDSLMDIMPYLTRLPAAGLLGGALFPVAVGLGSSFTHCAGMCGPIHLFLASRTPGGRAPWAYHAGRILGYGILGVTVGAMGGAFAALSARGFREAAGVALALAYAFFGLGLLGWVPKGLDAEKLLGRVFPARLFRAISSRGTGKPALFAAGLAASLLPCPSTHAVLLWGLGLGNPVAAGVGMLALGISTLPVFGVMARGSLSIPARARTWYRSGLGAVFLGLSAWRVYALAAIGTAACH